MVFQVNTFENCSDTKLDRSHTQMDENDPILYQNYSQKYLLGIPFWIVSFFYPKLDWGN